MNGTEMATMDNPKAAKETLKAYVVQLGKGRAGGITCIAEMLHIRPYTVEAWLKPETTKSSLPAPKWAMDQLALKIPLPVK
jgi:hypothetical protein